MASYDASIRSQVRKLAVHYPIVRALEHHPFLPSSNQPVAGRAVVIEFHTKEISSKVTKSVREFKNPEEVFLYLATPRTCARRLFLLEDLSPPYVEAFTQHLEVDPRAFASQARCAHYDDEFTSTQKGLRSCRELQQTRSDFLTLRYYEPWIFTPIPPDHLHCVTRTHLATKYQTNGVFRRPIEMCPYSVIADISNGALAHPGVADPERRVKYRLAELRSEEQQDTVRVQKHRVTSWRQTYFLRANASYWFRNYEDAHNLVGGTSWDDPGLSSSNIHCEDQERPAAPVRYQGGHPDLLQFSSFGESISAGPPSRSSLYDDIMHYWEVDENWSAHVTTANVAATYMIQLVAAHWNSALNQVWGSICNLEQELTNIEDFLLVHPEAHEEHDRWSLMEADLRHMNTIRRRLRYYVVEATENLRQVSRLVDGPWEASHSSLELDYRDIVETLNVYKVDASSLMDVAGNLASLLQAKKGLMSSYFVSLLTMVGVVVLPLTLLCGIFSMTGKFEAGAQLFWVYWALAIPLALIMLCLLHFGKLRLRRKQQRIPA